MSAQKTVAVIVGSVRKGSLSRKLAEALARIAPADLKLQIAEIGDLPYYDDDEANAPASWLRLRDEVRAADGVLFITPEYNRSVSGVLKNAVDVGSRPWGKAVWSGKPTAIISQSPGAIGGFGANHHLRQSLAALNVPVLPGPEAYLSASHQIVGDDGEIAKPETKAFLEGLLTAFSAWIDKHGETKTAA